MLPGPVMLDIEGTELTNEDRELLKHPAVGGVIYFARNYESPDQIYRLSKEIHELKSTEIFIAVDQEGGRVQRFKEGFTLLPAVAKIFDCFEHDDAIATLAARELGWLMASELLVSGIDFSFAPVLDLNYGLSSVIGDRSFAEKSDDVTRLAGAWMEGARKAGMINVGKHFPGHGGVKADSHLELPIDDRSLDEILATDIVPFKNLVADGLEGIMPAHVVYNECDEHPAGFSSYWLQKVLREQLGFNGVIFSDDLSMEGAASTGSYSDRANAALQAGCDMVLVCNNRVGVIEVVDALSHYSNPESQQRLTTLRAAPQNQSLSELQNSLPWTKASILANTIIKRTAEIEQA